MEGLLSPFLFAGPPGYRDGAIEALGISPTRRRRIREAVRRGERSKVGRILDELSDKELGDLADRLPGLLGEQTTGGPRLLDAPPADASKQPYLLTAHHPFADEIREGDLLLVDAQATPQDGDFIVLRDGAVRRLVRDGAHYRLVGGDDDESWPAAELFHRLEQILAGVVLEIRRVLPR